MDAVEANEGRPELTNEGRRPKLPSEIAGEDKLPPDKPPKTADSSVPEETTGSNEEPISPGSPPDNESLAGSYASIGVGRTGYFSSGRNGGEGG